MGRPFSDITLYAPTLHSNNTPEYWAETSLQNFICDLYVQRMNGYKPPNTTRITLQPAYHGIWNRTWKNGSLVHIAPAFSREQYDALDNTGKYLYILDVIQWSMLQLSNEYHWDTTVFERAYASILASQFVFQTDYPSKMSRDRNHSAHLRIEKTETLTMLLAVIQTKGVTSVIKLLDKKNWYWYDSVYHFPKCSKWFDNYRYGLHFPKHAIDIWYSIQDQQISLFKNNHAISTIDFDREFRF